MAKIPTNITLDAEVKEKATALLSELGLDLSTAVGIFLRQTIREKGLPFEVCLEEKPNEVTLAAMAAAENDEDMYGPFDSVAELMEALNA